MPKVLQSGESKPANAGSSSMPASRARIATTIALAVGAALMVLAFVTALHETHSFLTLNRVLHYDLETIGDVAIVLGLLCIVAVLLLHSRSRDLVKVADLHEQVRSVSEDLARRDPLTGLANRSTFTESMDSALGSAAWEQRNLVLMLGDVRSFVQINELLGHAIGDQLLKDFARNLQSAFPEALLIGRLAGNQFGVLLYADRAASEPQTKLPTQTSTALDHDGRTIDLPGLRVFWGVADSARCLSASFTLLQAAECALSSAKRANDRRIRLFDNVLKQDLLDEAGILADLPGAISRHDIFPYFQPLVDLESGSVIGFEVLARWNHPERGMIPPVRFIPLVRDVKLLTHMTEQMIAQACDEARYWPKRLTLAFNFNAEQLAQPWLAAAMLACLTHGGIAASRVVIEITEDVMGDNDAMVGATLQSFRNAGCKIALDDFGTGFSNIMRMRDFAVDYIKIDRTFVLGLPGEDATSLLAAMVLLAHSLNIEVVAEGIESEEINPLLRSLGVKIGQGYALGRPMPAKDVNVFILEAAAKFSRGAAAAPAQEPDRRWVIAAVDQTTAQSAEDLQIRESALPDETAQEPQQVRRLAS
jgi:diguanylate cyclase (GGDEF)-like protein